MEIVAKKAKFLYSLDIKIFLPKYFLICIYYIIKILLYININQQLKVSDLRKITLQELTGLHGMGKSSVARIQVIMKAKKISFAVH